MGKKVNPIGIRLGYTKKSSSFWYSDKKNFSTILKSDIQIREYIINKLKKYHVMGNIFIERMKNNVKIIIKSSKPGVIIGKKGEEIEKLRVQLYNKYKISVNINILEIKKPDLDAIWLANNISSQIKKRIVYKRIIKRSIFNAMKYGARGIKIMISGRLGGIDIARKEWFKEGRVPLHTLKSDIDYATSTVNTSYGVIGIKVWVYKGDIIKKYVKT